MSDRPKRRWGDRRDGRRVRDLSGLATIMPHLYPERTDCEVYINDLIDVTELLRYLEAKNGPDAPYKTTLFHCIVTAVARLLIERPKLNRFIAGHRVYERNEISLGFVAKRKFTDHAEESLVFLVPKPDATLADISREIVGDVNTLRSEHSSHGIDSVLDAFAKIPRPILMLVIRIVRWLDFWGKVPRALTEGDIDYASVLLTNLGSVKCPSIYHHLNNYGTNSIVIAIGTIHKAPVVMDDGSIQVRDMVDIGVTLDERIADGFYFARSLKLIKHICSHPELLDRPISEESGYEY